MDSGFRQNDEHGKACVASQFDILTYSHYLSPMRTTVRLPEDLMRRAKEKAHREGLTLTAFIEEGVRLAIARKGPAKAKYRFPPISSATGGVLPGVDTIKTADLLAMDDFAYVRMGKK
jgi:hypothetical protein